MEKQIILFGAGEFGRKAFKYFGADLVAYFADNNPKRTGETYLGKKIISFSELEKIKDKYTVCIAAERYVEIEEQLRSNNFKSFYVFDSTAFECFDRNKIEQYSTVAVYGVSDETEWIVEELKRRNIKNIYLTDRDENIKAGERADGIQIKYFKDVIDIAGCIVIVSSRYHIAAEVRLQRLLQSKKNIKILSPFKKYCFYPEDELVFNFYKYDVESFSEAEFNEREKKRTAYFDDINAYVQEAIKYTSLFKLVEVETYNRCNGACEFCPVNRKSDPRPECHMKKETFEKIIRELKELDYDGRISLFSNNEPLLDDRIFEFSEYARKELPKARIHMFTNGTLLTLEKFLKLIDNLDELIIDNYQQDLKIIKSVQEVKEYCEQHPELIKKVSIIMRKPKEILTTRGGDAPNRKVKASYPKVSCALPFQQLVIRPTGEISLCCNDPLGKYTMGDVTKQKIIDIWYGEKYRELRKAIADGRKNVDHCKYCDVFSLYS